MRPRTTAAGTLNGCLAVLAQTVLGLLPCSSQAQRDLKVTKQGYGTAERFRAQDTLLYPHLLPPLSQHMVFALLEPPRNLKARSIGDKCQVSLRRQGKYYRPAQRPAAASWCAHPERPPTLQNFAQAGSAHTCSIQKFLVHAVSEAAEQAMGSHHALLQILSGDGIIRIPLFHLTAEGKESHSKDAGSLLAELANTAFHLLWP